MKKYIIEESEKNRILNMHQSLLKEQASGDVSKPINDQLQAFVDKGCFPNGNPKVVKMKSTNPQKGYAIKIESTKTPGKFRYFFIDNSVGQMEGGTFQFLPSKWSCNTQKIEVKKAEQTAITTANNANIDKIKKEGNWSIKKDLLDSGETEQNIENPIMYEKGVFSGETLYRRKTSSSIGTGLTQDQKDLIKYYEDLGYKLRKDLKGEDIDIFKAEVVSPASDGIFSQDLIMYYDPKLSREGIGTGDTKQKIGSIVKNDVKGRTVEDKNYCKQTIEDYYISWKKKRPLTPRDFRALKTEAQACKNEFYQDWGGLFSGGKKVDEFIEIMSGIKPGGPSSSGGDAQWRLN